MKEILIVRHAKSSWTDLSLSDIDRPLNSRGKRDAPAMAEFLFNRSIIPQKCISSPAKRARLTAKAYTKKFYGKSKFEIDLDLYHGYKEDYLQVLQNIEDTLDFVAIFGHNPMINNFVDAFSNQSIYNIPTCGTTYIKINIDSWNDLRFNKDVIIEMFFPKEVL